jgi:predicted aconitase with swiveling domain
LGGNWGRFIREKAEVSVIGGVENERVEVRDIHGVYGGEIYGREL